MAEKKRQHRGYTRKGRKLPSVTEILKGLGWGNERLMFWANKLGRQGLWLNSADATFNRDAGTRTHDYVENFLRDGSVPLPPSGDPRHEDYDRVGARAYEHLLSFIRLWEDGGLKDRVDILAIECKMTGEINGLWYGGTADLICLLDGVPCVMDLKTGNGIHGPVAIQLEAYSHLWWYDGHKHTHDALGRALTPAAFERRKTYGHIGRTAVIHTQPEHCAELVVIDDDTRRTAHHMWLLLVALQGWRPGFENFELALEEHNAVAKLRREARENNEKPKLPWMK